MSVLLEFAMFPTDRGESVSKEVSEVIRTIRELTPTCQLTPMGSIIETDSLDEALAVVKAAYQALEKLGCQRVYSSLKLDIRPGKTGRMQGKIASVEARIGTAK